MRPHPLLPLVLVPILTACGGDAPPPPVESGPPPITILGAMVIDGTGAAPIVDGVVVIRGDRIEVVGTRADTPVPKGGEIIDGTGQVVIPGLIDLHCHYGGGRELIARDLVTQLRFGVTTARSMGTDGDEHRTVFADVEAGHLAGPRLFSAGRGFSHPDGNPPSANGPTTVDDARALVRENAAHDADFVKMWVDSWYGWVPKIAPEIRAAVVDEATRHGIPAVAHIFDQEDVRQLAELGVRQFLHGVRAADVDTAFVAMARERGLSFAPALSKAQDFWFLAEEPAELDDPELREAFRPARLEQITMVETRDAMLANPQLDQLRGAYTQALRFVKTMQDGGVTIAVGSDSGAGWVPFGWGTHHEMRLLVEAGLTPLEALAAATGNAARQLAGDEPDFGILAAGKTADLVMLSANPLADIRSTRAIERVMQAGAWFPRD